MLFNSFVFLFAFLPVTYRCLLAPEDRAAAVRLARPHRLRLLRLLGRTVLPPDGVLDVVSYLAGLGFLRWRTPVAAGLCLVVPITVDLLLLGFFKYADFGLDDRPNASRTGWGRTSPSRTSTSSCRRHFVLHLPHHQLHRRQLSGRHPADPELLRIRLVRVACSRNWWPVRSSASDRSSRTSRDSGRPAEAAGSTSAHPFSSWGWWRRCWWRTPWPPSSTRRWRRTTSL